MTKCLVFLTCFCPVLLASSSELIEQIYDEVHTLENSDVTYDITFQNNTEFIKLHSDVLKKSTVLAAELEDKDFKHEPIVRAFVDSAEAQVFKKILYFLYKDSLTFENREIPQLCVMANKFAIDSLGQLIAQKLAKNIEKQLRDSHSQCILDVYNREQLGQFLLILRGLKDSVGTTPDTEEKNWINSLYESMLLYLQIIRINDDTRILELAYQVSEEALLKNDLDKIIQAPDPNLIKQMRDMRNEYEEKHALENYLSNKSSEIKIALAKKALKTSHKKSFKYTVNVSDKYARELSSRLQVELPAYEVSISMPPEGDAKNHLVNPGNTDLPSWLNNPFSMACCLATGIGYLVQTICCPLQCATLHWCCCCCTIDDNKDVDSCYCGTEIGAWAAYCTYQSLTCCKRKIQIAPRAPGDFVR